MGQIQNAITSAIGSVAVGAIANKNMAEIKQDLAKKKAENADLQEYMTLNAELIDDLQNPVVNRDEKKGTLAVKVSEQQAKSKSQQKKKTKQRFEIKKGGLRRL